MEKTEIGTDNDGPEDSAVKQRDRDTVGAQSKKWQSSLPKHGGLELALQDGATRPHFHQEQRSLSALRNHFLSHSQC